MEWSNLKNLIGGKDKQELPVTAGTIITPNEARKQATPDSQTDSGPGPVHGWIAAGRDPRAVITGGLMGASTLFR